MIVYNSFTRLLWGFWKFYSKNAFYWNPEFKFLKNRLTLLCTSDNEPYFFCQIGTDSCLAKTQGKTAANRYIGYGFFLGSPKFLWRNRNLWKIKSSIRMQEHTLWRKLIVITLDISVVIAQCDCIYFHFQKYPGIWIDFYLFLFLPIKSPVFIIYQQITCFQSDDLDFTFKRNQNK